MLTECSTPAILTCRVGLAGDASETRCARAQMPTGGVEGARPSVLARVRVACVCQTKRRIIVQEGHHTCLSNIVGVVLERENQTYLQWLPSILRSHSVVKTRLLPLSSGVSASVGAGVDLGASGVGVGVGSGVSKGSKIGAGVIFKVGAGVGPGASTGSGVGATSISEVGAGVGSGASTSSGVGAGVGSGASPSRMNFRA